MEERVAFNTANLVARVTGYRFELKRWGEQHQRTVAETDEDAWRDICREIAAAGFRAVEVWEAHCSPDAVLPERAGGWRRALDEFGLQPVAYAGQVRRETLEVCRALGIPHIDGGLAMPPAEATRLCREFGIGYNFENHPEKGPDEILSRIDGGNEWLGV